MSGLKTTGPRRSIAYSEEIIAGAALVVVIASTCWGVLTRYITEQPATWTSEIASIAYAWVVFVGAAAGFKYGMHVAIDMLMVRLPGGLRRVLRAAADLLVLLFLAVLFCLAVEFSIDAWDDPTSVLRLPRTVTYAAVVVGVSFMFVRYAQVAWRGWNGLHGSWMQVSGEAAGAEL